MPLTLIGLLSLSLGTLAIVTGRLPVTAKLTWSGRRAKIVGWICWGFGLLCMVVWGWLMVDQYLFSAR